MKEFLVLTVLLIQTQDSDNFKTREYTTGSLEYLAYIYDIRPALNETIANKKNSLEVRKRCERVNDLVIQLYLNDMKYRQVPDLPIHTKWYYKKNPKILFDAYYLARTISGAIDATELDTVEVPYTVKEYINQERNNGLSDKEILKELEIKINGIPTKKSG